MKNEIQAYMLQELSLLKWQGEGEGEGDNRGIADMLVAAKWLKLFSRSLRNQVEMRHMYNFRDSGTHLTPCKLMLIMRFKIFPSPV